MSGSKLPEFFVCNGVPKDSYVFYLLHIKGCWRKTCLLKDMRENQLISKTASSLARQPFINSFKTVDKHP